MPRPWKIALLLFTSFLLTPAVHAEMQVLREAYSKLGRTLVEVDSVFGPAARNGALPFRIRIQNDSGKDRSWTIQLQEGAGGRTLKTSVAETFLVKNGATVSHEMILPFAPEFTAYSYRNLQVIVSSPGLDTVNRNTGYQTVTNIPTIALSSKLALRSLAALDKATSDKNSSNPRFGDSFQPEHLPTDWRGYSGLDLLLIDIDSWKSLEQAQRRAVLEWIRMGGSLELFLNRASGDTETKRALFNSLGIDGLFHSDEKNDFARLSLGTITIRYWNGKELEKSVAFRYTNANTRSANLDREFDGSWELADQFGSREFNSALIFILLLIFAILVAPINLFYFAGPGRRHRLFITTPIISLAACLVVMLIIFVGDGVGGRGYRIAFADLQSGNDEMRIYLTQEQVSRTGVTIQSGFTSERKLAIDPVNLRESEFNTMKQGSGLSTQFQFDRENFRGGFFRSRSEQGYSIRAVEPTRSRIEKSGAPQGSGAPKLVSSLPSAIEFLAYHDEDGKFWQTAATDPIPPGSAIPLEPIDEETFEEWITSNSNEFNGHLRKRIRYLANQPGRFFAVSLGTSDYLLDTYDGIDWELEKVLLSGSISGGAESGDAESGDSESGSKKASEPSTPSVNE